jgi:hypothetical protein
MKPVLGIISIIGAAAYGMAVVRLCDPAFLEMPHVKASLAGFLLGAGIWLVLGRKLSFFNIFEHEFTHLVFGLLMFQRPRSFYASERRGSVSSDSGNFIDGLAPYYFPTFSYMLLALYPLLKTSAHDYFYPVLGFLTGYHLVSNFTEFGIRQSDVRRAGAVFSIVFCVFAGTLAFGFLLAFVLGGFTGGLKFLGAGWAGAIQVIKALVGFVERLLSLVATRAGA